MANTGNFALAAKCYGEAVKLCPQYLDAWANLAACLIDQYKFLEALIILEKAERIGYTFDMAITYGRCLVHLNRPEEALAKFQKAKELGQMTHYLQEDIEAAKWHIRNR